MSSVTNYIVEFGWGEEHRNEYFFLNALHKHLDEHLQTKLKDNIRELSTHHNAYHGNKVLESDSYVYALNYVSPESFEKAVKDTIKKIQWTGGVQVLYLGQEDEHWIELLKIPSEKW